MHLFLRQQAIFKTLWNFYLFSMNFGNHDKCNLSKIVASLGKTKLRNSLGNGFLIQIH